MSSISNNDKAGRMLGLKITDHKFKQEKSEA